MKDGIYLVILRSHHSLEQLSYAIFLFQEYKHAFQRFLIMGFLKEIVLYRDLAHNPKVEHITSL